MKDLITVSGVRGFVDENGMAQLNAEDVARGWGFVTVAKSGNEVVRWARVNEYLAGFGFSQQVGKDKFIPENMVYRLGFKATNETAQKFQALLADEVIPSIRKHGAYMTPATIEEILLNPDTLIRLATELKQQQEANRKLQQEKSVLQVDNAIMHPKAEYFDELVDRNLLTNIRDTAKELNVKERDFINFLIEKKYLYRDKRNKLMPYAKKNKGLFEIKECFNDKSNWKGVQTLITPRGRETFRLLCKGGA